MNGIKLHAIFAITVLLVGVSANNLAYGDDDYSDRENDSKEKIETAKEIKKEQKEALKEERKEKIEQTKEHAKELREEYKKKLEEKKKIFADYKKEMKEKYRNLLNEFKEKYAQLRISSSDVDADEIESKIKLNELRLLKYEFRENIKNLKLEAKQHFDAYKSQLKEEQTDRKNKIQDRINEIKEKYKNKIREHHHLKASNVDASLTDYESKKIEICHIPSDNPDNAQTLSISVSELRAHLAHGDYIGECEIDDETNDEEENETNDQEENEDEEGQTIHVELKEDLGFTTK